MMCPRCRYENPEGSNFCGQCATAMAAAGATELRFGEASKLHPWAVVGFILSFFGGVFGLLVCVRAWMTCHTSRGKLRGEQLALAGIFISIASALGQAFLYWFVVMMRGG